MQQERKEISGKANTIAGFSIPLYLGILALVVVCMYMDCLPAGLVGGMIALMVLGEGLNFLGNHTPVVKTYLGGSVICILGAAVIQALGLIPEQTHEILDNFVNKEGFLVFYISALITGSLFQYRPWASDPRNGETASDSCHIAGSRRDTFRSARYGDGG